MIGMAAISAILAGAQLIGGVAGMAKNKRPKYKIPASVLAATKLAQMRSEGDMPGYDQASGNINLMAANALAGARETGRAGEQLQSIVGQSNKSYGTLATQNAQYQSQTDLLYEDALRQQGQFEEQKWQINEFAPYADRQQRSEDMFGAGAQNLFNAATMMDGELSWPKKREKMTPLTKLPSLGALKTVSSISSQRTLPNSSIRPVYDLARLSLLGL